MLKIAITGSTGLIGSRLVELFSSEFEFIPLRHNELDITNTEEVKKKLNSIEFDMFLHLAAYTNVDGAETDRTGAYKLNVEATRNIFNEVHQKQKKMIYVSTDFVFDGLNPPFFEDTLPRPINYYGQTKYEGEKIVKDQAMIIRLSYPYRKEFEVKKDFVRTIKSLLEQGKELKMVSDSQFVPTFIDDIAYTMNQLIRNYTREIYHLVGGSVLSPFEAGKMIARNWNLDENLIQPVTYAEYFAGKAPRPKLCDIRSNKNNFYTMKSFEEGLSAIS